MKKEKKAFTLAEVLIALTIIGVVSALTIPTLVQKTNKQEYVSALQKTYSTLSQAAQMIIAEEGSPKAGENGESWLTSSDTLYNMFKKHLSGIKECGSGTDCFEQLKNNKYRYLDGSYDNNNWNEHAEYNKLVLSDGSQIIFHYPSNGNQCGVNVYGSEKICAFIYADVNGAKKPNMYGRDVFHFVLKENGLYPRGCDNGACPQNLGLDCACRVIREGRMDY